MRIGFFSDGYFPTIDGVAYTLKTWRDRLEAAGHEVWIFYPDAKYNPDAREIPIRSLPNPFYAGYRIGLFRRASKLPELDVIHSHSPGPIGLLGLYYAQKHSLPAIYTHHTPIEEYFHESINSESVAGLLSEIYVPIENNIIERFDMVTTSTGDLDRNVEPFELPVGIDLEFFTPRETGPTENQTLIGYSGRMSLEKNLDEILKVAETFTACDFVMVGEGPQREALEARAPDNVVFHDFLPREILPDFYSALDVYVIPSTADTLGLSPLEANACGTPVAAADVPPFTTTIGPENGARFEFGDQEDMARAIDCCLAGSWDTRSQVEKYSVDRTIGELETIYSQLQTKVERRQQQQRKQRR